MMNYFLYPIAGAVVSDLLNRDATKKNNITNNENIDFTKSKIFLGEGKNSFLRTDNKYLHISTGDPFYIKEENGNRIIYYRDLNSNSYGSFNLNDKTLLPLTSSILQSPAGVRFISLINDFMNSAYIDSDKKKMIKELLDKYMADMQLGISSNAGRKILNFFRIFEKPATIEELEEFYDKSQKDKNYNGNLFSFNYEEKVKYKTLKDDLNKLSDVLFDAFNDAKKAQDDFSLTITKAIKNYKGNTLSKNMLLQASNSVLFQEALYSFYKENGCNLKVALEEFVRNQVKNGLLFYDQQLIQKGNIPNIVGDSNNISLLNDEYIDEQVDRYFKLENVKKTQDTSLMVDEKNGFVVFNDEGRCNCIFDLNNLDKDLENPCYFAAISRMFERMCNINDQLNLNSKTVDQSDRMRGFLSELYEKISSLKEEDGLDKEAISIALLHYVKTLTALDVPSRLDIKQRPAISLSSLVVKKTNGEEYTNYMFDITDPISNTYKTCTILRNGDRIFFKQEPGNIGIQEIDFEKLLQILPSIDDLCKEGVEAPYVGDVWAMRKMIHDLQSIRDKQDELAEEQKSEIYNGFSNVSISEKENLNKNNIANLASIKEQEKMDKSF